MVSVRLDHLQTPISPEFAIHERYVKSESNPHRVRQHFFHMESTGEVVGNHVLRGAHLLRWRPIRSRDALPKLLLWLHMGEGALRGFLHLQFRFCVSLGEPISFSPNPTSPVVDAIGPPALP